MNYLAHLYLGARSPELMAGSLLGDFVKGRIGNEYSEQISHGIALHRKIDVYTDAHPRTHASRELFSVERRRFAGIIIDVTYDHFLARHWSRYSEQTLPEFIVDAQAVLESFTDVFPDRLQRILPRMFAENWLASYAHMAGVERALDGIATRLKRGERLAGAIEEVEHNYQGLESNFLDFFPDVSRYANAHYEKLISTD